MRRLPATDKARSSAVRGARQADRRAQEQHLLGLAPRFDRARQVREEIALLHRRIQRRAGTGPQPIRARMQRVRGLRRRGEVGLREELALPAVLAVQAAAHLHPWPQPLDPARFAQQDCGAAEEDCRQLRRGGRQLAPQRAPRGGGVEAAAAEARGREIEECRRAVAAERLPGRQGLTEGEPARESRGAERAPRRRRAPIVALGEHRGGHSEAIAGLEQACVDGGPKRLRGGVGGGAGGIVEQMAAEPDAAHARVSPIAYRLSQSRV
jgi:hypothetical protein